MRWGVLIDFLGLGQHHAVISNSSSPARGAMIIDIAHLQMVFRWQVAAAKAGVSVASARRIESTVLLPSQKPARTWRTRADPLTEVWTAEVVPMLEAAPGLMAVTAREALAKAARRTRTPQRRIQLAGAPWVQKQASPADTHGASGGEPRDDRSHES